MDATTTVLFFFDCILLGYILGSLIARGIGKVVSMIGKRKTDKPKGETYSGTFGKGPFAAASDEALVDMYKALSKDWLDNILGRYYSLAEHSLAEMTKVSDEIVRRASAAKAKQYADMAAEIGTGR